MASETVDRTIPRGPKCVANRPPGEKDSRPAGETRSADIAGDFPARYVTSPWSLEGTIQTLKCLMREGQSREIPRLRSTWLAFQFRVYSLWHSLKQLLLIRWLEQAK